jgi:hypothetical protein
MRRSGPRAPKATTRGLPGGDARGLQAATCAPPRRGCSFPRRPGPAALRYHGGEGDLVRRWRSCRQEHNGADAIAGGGAPGVARRRRRLPAVAAEQSVGRPGFVRRRSPSRRCRMWRSAGAWPAAEPSHQEAWLGTRG